MRNWIKSISAVLIVCAMLNNAVVAQTVIACPAAQLNINDVDFNASDCLQSSLDDLVLPSKSVWLKLNWPEPDSAIIKDAPLGLFISGFFSFSAYVNGNLIGANGQSAIQGINEIAGQFDWVGYVPRSVLRNDENYIALHLSTFEDSRIQFHPFNRFFIGKYKSPTYAQLNDYWPSFIPLGAILLSLVYVCRRLMLEGYSFGLLCLLALAGIAAIQLVCEVYRGLTSYPYPWHLIRLNIIIVTSTLFGQLLFIQSVRQFSGLTFKWLLVPSISVVIAVQSVVDNPDLAATTAIQLPAIFAACLILFEAYRSANYRYTPAIVLILFSVLIAITPHRFLDVYLYYCIAGLLAYLFMQEAQSRVNDLKSLETEIQRGEKLQLALDMQSAKDDQYSVTLREGAKLNVVGAANILFCKGAGDYVEVSLNDKSVLHSGSLNGIGEALPAYFIRVHRSYIVNAKHLAHLRRLPAGTGEITLTNGQVIPVSRRLLPKLKESLAS